jgi:Nucleoside diphosphate kinase
MERTCVIVKPDAVCRKFSGDIIKRIDSEGLKLLALKMIKPGMRVIEGFYAVHKDRSFFDQLVKFMNSAPVIVMAWEGEKAVSKVRAVIGATNSKEAVPGTIRNLFGTDNRKNAVHASDSVENAELEIAYFFKPEEQMSYSYGDWENYK